jgi:hypothetical protein
MFRTKYRIESGLFMSRISNDGYCCVYIVQYSLTYTKLRIPYLQCVRKFAVHLGYGT